MKTNETPSEEFIVWNGGNCPVRKSLIVEVKFRGGAHEQQSAYAWDWWHYGCPYDIFAYRLIK